MHAYWIVSFRNQGSAYEYNYDEADETRLCVIS